MSDNSMLCVISMDRKYPFTCCACGEDQFAAPSIAMLVGVNSGFGACLNCDTHLHLSVDDGKERMTSKLWADFVEEDA